MHINPDHFLETPDGRVVTPERNAVAWEQCFAALDAALRERSSRSVVYVMIGSQASGKSTWARGKHREDPDAIIFDAILVKRVERQPILLAAEKRRVPVAAVWLQTPLQVCVERNAARPLTELVNEQGLRNVFAALEPPQLSEGFSRIIEVEYTHMPILRIQHSVPDFEGWKRAFEHDPLDRKAAGVRRYHVRRAVADPNFVMIDLEFDSVAEAEAMLTKLRHLWAGPGGKVMRNPEAWIVETVESTSL